MRIRLGDRSPDVDATAWTAPTATLIGGVRLGPQASVWYSAVVRADSDDITIGARSNVQDCCALHTDAGFHLRIGEGVSIGHSAVVHGCVIEDDVLIGMGAVIMNGAVVGTGSMVGAGAIVSAGVVVPPRSLVVGVPGKVRRETTDEELLLIRANSDIYLEHARRHAAGVVLS